MSSTKRPKAPRQKAKKVAKAKGRAAAARRVSTTVARHPCVLAIGGLDPGGGAGVLADARAIARAGAFACGAVALLTVQSTSGLRSATSMATRELVAECTEVLKSQNVRAIKVGALGSEENAKGIGDLLAIHRDVPAVIDTVMLPTRGHGRLLEERAISVLRKHVLRRAALVTANIPEAEVLTNRRITRLDEAREAALALLEFGSQAVLLKGGHLVVGEEAVDLLVIRRPRENEDDEEEPEPEPKIIELRAPRLRLARPVHGGGCILASLIAGRLAIGKSLVEAVRWAKKTHHEALADARDVGGDMHVLFANLS